MRFLAVTKPITICLCIFVALISWRFLVLGVEVSMNFMLYHAQQRPVFFYAHVGFAPLALLLMPLQFYRKLREARPDFHRWIGRVYGVAILVSGVSGLFLAVNSNAGLIAAGGFFVLSVLWLVTTAMGIWCAYKGLIVEHRVWIMRSAALTFAAVTLRLYLPILPAMGLSFEASYSLIAWACWVPNLIFVEFFRRHS